MINIRQTTTTTTSGNGPETSSKVHYILIIHSYIYLTIQINHLISLTIKKVNYMVYEIFAMWQTFG